MSKAPKRLGLLIACRADSEKFRHASCLIESALNRGLQVFVYLLDEAVLAVGTEGMESLRAKGMKLHACSNAARERGLELSDNAVFSGLPVVGDLIKKTDHFLSFT